MLLWRSAQTVAALVAALLGSFACASWPGESSAIKARLMVACRVA